MSVRSRFCDNSSKCSFYTHLANEKKASCFNIIIFMLFTLIGLDARIYVFGGLRTIQVQSDQRLCYSLVGKYHI